MIADRSFSGLAYPLLTEGLPVLRETRNIVWYKKEILPMIYGNS